MNKYGKSKSCQALMQSQTTSHQMTSKPSTPQPGRCTTTPTGWGFDCKGPGPSLPGLMGVRGGPTRPTCTITFMLLAPSTSQVQFHAIWMITFMLLAPSNSQVQFHAMCMIMFTLLGPSTSQVQSHAMCMIMFMLLAPSTSQVESHALCHLC